MAYNMKKHLRHSEAHAERGLLLFRAVAFAVCAMFAVLYAQTPSMPTTCGISKA